MLLLSPKRDCRDRISVCDHFAAYYQFSSRLAVTLAHMAILLSLRLDPLDTEANDPLKLAAIPDGDNVTPTRHT